MASNTPYALMEATAKKMIEKKYKMLREKFTADLNYADTATNVVINKLIDEVILDTVAEFHRAVKTGCCEYLFCTDRDVENSLNNSDGHPFEEEVEKKTEDIKCPNCTRPINASRFAPHLEKCMKMGRNSSRIASRRIANNSKENSYSGIVSDDDDDEDWSAISEKIKISKKIQDPKKKKDKPRKQKLTRNPKEEHTDSKEALPYSKFIIMNSEDKVTFLSNSCGVKIETSGKMCSRSVRCTHHTDDERLALRKLYSLEGVHQDNFVDVEEVEGSKMEAENSCTSSPADSTSTSSSSSTKKKDKKQKPIKSKYSTEQYIPE